jgi:hypothetical protein
MGCTLLSVLLNEPTKRPNRHDDWVVCLGLALVVTAPGCGRVGGVHCLWRAHRVRRRTGGRPGREPT